MSKNKLELLYEALKDMAKDTDTVHYTDLDGLMGIMKDGKLKAQNYMDKAKENTIEVATLRRSKDRYLQAMKKKDPKKYDMEIRELSGNIGFVKIYLHSNRIKASLPNVSKSPVSEFYKFNNRVGKITYKNLIELYGKQGDVLTKEKINKTVKAHLGEIVRDIGIEKMKNSNWRVFKDRAKKIVKTSGLNTTNTDVLSKLEEEWCDALQQGRYLFYPSSMGREAEERFSFGIKPGENFNDIGIPVNPLYMKIRIISPSDESENEEDNSEETIKELKELRANIGKHEDVFLKDKDFFKFKKKLDDIINKNTK